MTTTKNKCLIIGGTGFIGSHLVKKLISLGFPVTVISLGKPQKDNNLYDVLDQINYIEGNINDLDLLKKSITPDSYIFDMATASVPATSPIDTLDEIKHHISLFEISCQQKVKKIIFMSSGGGVYGDKKVMPISETSHLQPSSAHAIGKTTLEYFLHFYCQNDTIPFLIYRISNPYGPFQTSKPGFGLIPTLFSNVKSHTQPILYDNGQAVRDFIYIDDLIDAISISFSERNKYHTYNVGSSKGIKTIDVWNDIKNITQSSLIPNFLPKRDFDIKRYILDTTRFQKEYDWDTKINLSTGLKITWEWMTKTF